MKRVDPSGTWRWETTQDGSPQRHSLILQADKSGRVVGVYSGIVKDLKSKKGIINGNQLELEFEWEQRDKALRAKYIAMMTRNKATGSITISTEEREFVLPWAAERRLQLSDVVGDWNIRLGDDEAKLHIKADGGRYVGTWTGNETGRLPIRNLRVKRDLIFYSVSGQADESVFVAEFAARPLGDKLKGEMVLTLPNHEFEIEFTGRRGGENSVSNGTAETDRGPDADDLVGIWHMRTELADDVTLKLTISRKGEKYIVTCETDDIDEFRVRHLKLKGNQLVLSISGFVDKQKFAAECAAVFEGDKLFGEIGLQVGAESEGSLLTGERIE